MPKITTVEQKKNFVQFLEDNNYINKAVRTIERATILDANTIFKNKNGDNSVSWIVANPNYREDRGVYKIPYIYEIAGSTSSIQNDDDLEKEFLANTFNVAVVTDPVQSSINKDAFVSNNNSKIIGIDLSVSLVPDKIQSYVPWGHWRDLHRILNSRRFMNCYITGFTGNGKTTLIEQLCADLGRDYVRANITQDTDETDLIGGFRLQNGETIFEYGPVVNAMIRGAVLLLDEIDLASPKIMCLQPVLEGKPIFIKKINKWIHPAPGFVVMATANTKGKGSDTGHFVGANFLNEAFLDRFAITFEQPYAPEKSEIKILSKFYKSVTGTDPDEIHDNIFSTLVQWASKTRKQFEDGSISDMISTRRLLDIVNHYTIFNDISKSVDACTARFSAEECGAFRDTFKLMYSESLKKNEEPVNTETKPLQENDCPF